jgi:hypothetical protein
MNRERFKKVIVWLTLTCVLALPVAATFTSPVSAQGHHRRYIRRGWHGHPAFHPRAKFHHRRVVGPRRVIKFHGRPHRFHRRFY